MIVVDTNIIAYLLTPDPFQTSALALYAEDPEWVAPPLWRSEFRGVLNSKIRHEEVTLDQASALADEAESILKNPENLPGSRAILELAQASGCTTYDCEYVALALKLGVPLVTMDKQVLKAFPRFAVPLAA